MTLGLCRFTNANGGTVDWTYPGPTTDMQSPTSAGAVNGTVYKYYAQSLDMEQWEIGTGAYTASTRVFARTTVLFNSDGDTSKINFTNPPQVIVFDSTASLLAALGVTAIGTASVGQIPGDQSGLTPAAGTIGEEVHSTGSTAGNYTSGSPQLVCTLNIPSAGDWDVSGENDLSGSGSTSTSDWQTLISTVSTPTISNAGSFPAGSCHDRRPAGLDYSLRQIIGAVKFVTTGAVTLYMYGQVTIASGTVFTSVGAMRARRMR